jgi:hypothetical protein
MSSLSHHDGRGGEKRVGVTHSFKICFFKGRSFLKITKIESYRC